MMTDPHNSGALASYGAGLRVAVIGATGGIGAAFCAALGSASNVETVYRCARKPADGLLPLDITDEESIADTAQSISEVGPLHAVIVATGLLHDGDQFQPEKNMRALNAVQLQKSFEVNAIGPALVAKHFLPLLERDRKTVFAALSARVGSIEDNHIGGWYGYRASKAALNMMIKTLAIEYGRTRKHAAIVGLHPGTVDTGLSQPFQGAVPDSQVVTPEVAAKNLLRVLDGLDASNSGNLYAWDGQRIPF